MDKDCVAIIDFGSQFTQLIARKIRELGVYSEIFSLQSFRYKKEIHAIILSGGPNSVDDTDWYEEVHNAELEEKIFSVNKKQGVAILGLCFGKQLICKYFGAEFSRSHQPEFGKAEIRACSTGYQNDCRSILYKTLILPNGFPSHSVVWMSHYDSLNSLPEGFIQVASTERCNYAIIEDKKRKIYGLQFHPEVSHTVIGTQLLENFLSIAGCRRDWKMVSFIENQVERIKSLIGTKKVIAAVSGGVDSTVAAALAYKAIGSNLYCIFIDTGLLRKDEAENVKKTFEDKFHICVHFCDRSDLFLARLKSVSNSEQKRKIIGKTFIDVFEEEAKSIAGSEFKNVESKSKLGNAESQFTFLLQGTLYPDVIESGLGHSANIKSHHNVGALPEKLDLKLLEPLRFLFKDEVRKLGIELGIDRSIISRHPFPGPGLAVRIIGEVTKEKVKILQEADNIFMSEMKRYKVCGRAGDFYRDIWQAFVILLPVKTVGVMGDSRTYEYACVLRTVSSQDGMTADAFPFDCGDANFRDGFFSFLKNVSNRIVNEVRGINRVTYDLTSKPPGTIEWE